MSKHYFASSLLMVREGRAWRGTNLELGIQQEGATFREALDALIEAVGREIGKGAQSSRSSEDWELFQRTLDDGVACGIGDPVTALAECVAVPTLFVLQNEGGERVQWKGHCHGARALARRP